MKISMFSLFVLIFMTACNQNNNELKAKNLELSNKIQERDAEIKNITAGLQDAMSKLEVHDTFLKNKIKSYQEYKIKNQYTEAANIYKDIMIHHSDSNEAILLKLLERDNRVVGKDNKVEEGEKLNASVISVNEPKRISIKDLKEISKCTVGDVDIHCDSQSISKKWVFDRNGHSYYYRDADKGSSFFVLNFTAKSKNKNPNLPPIVAATVEGDGKLNIINLANIKFPSWSDFGSYLGNYHDFNNDFAKRESIRFTSAIDISEDLLKTKRVVVFIPELNCVTRGRSDSHPPVFYSEYPCMNAVKEIDDISKVKNVIKNFGK